MRALPFLFALFLAGLFFYFFFLSGKSLQKFTAPQNLRQSISPPSRENLFSSPHSPQKMSIHGTTYSVYSGNEKIWEIQAKTLKGNAKTMKAFQIRGILYRKEKPYFHLRTPLALLDLTTKNLIFPEGTVIRGENGEKMFTHYLTWDSRKEKFFGSKGVEVIQQGARLQGEKLEWGKPFTVIQLQGHTKGNTNK